MNLIEGLLSEIDRNEELARLYDTIPTGAFAARMIRYDIERAKDAMGSGDTVRMLRAYQTLKKNE